MMAKSKDTQGNLVKICFPSLSSSKTKTKKTEKLKSGKIPLASQSDANVKNNFLETIWIYGNIWAPLSPSTVQAGKMLISLLIFNKWN